SEAREAANASVASASTASLVPAASLGAPLVAAALTPTLPRVRPAGEAGAPRRAEPPAHRPAAPAAHPAVEAGGPVAAPARSAGALLEDVRRALKRRDAAAAAALLDSCSARLPADSGAAALERLALLEASLKLPPARVEGHARRALQLGAESVHLDLCLGRSLDRLGRGEEAGRWYRRATQITADPEGVDPDRRSAYFLWADALYRRSAAEDALAAYAEALRAYPAAAECPWALYQSAKLEQRLGRSADAVAHVRELTARFPDDYWTAQARARLAGLPAPRLATR
ncbi:MAG TPA: hypothetical protein VMS93_02155, partial [Candidatus Saccharimonadales bacterium]|nr:hypothetical protein [Candidatus Saccharimonadales bacterium]